MNRFRNYFIGKYLSQTNDVFETARVLMFYRFILAFAVLFILPVAADYAMGLDKALIKHGIDLISIILLLFFLRFAFDLDKVINFFFSFVYVSYQIAFIMLNPNSIDTVGFLWAVFFLGLSALLQRGIARIIYCGFLGWLPIFYVLLNIHFKGALTVQFLVEKEIEDPPLFLLFLPIVLLIVAIWSHTNTIQKARETITAQKRLVDEKQKEILDSIHYAKRIQTALMTPESIINKTLDRLK